MPEIIVIGHLLSKLLPVLIPRIGTNRSYTRNLGSRSVAETARCFYNHHVVFMYL